MVVFPFNLRVSVFFFVSYSCLSSSFCYLILMVYYLYQLRGTDFELVSDSLIVHRFGFLRLLLDSCKYEDVSLGVWSFNWLLSFVDWLSLLCWCYCVQFLLIAVSWRQDVCLLTSVFCFRLLQL